MKNGISILLITVIVLSIPEGMLSQVHSIDVKPKTSQQFSFKKIFGNHGGKEKRKHNREERKHYREIKKESRLQRKAVKKYWKTMDRPKEMAANRKVVHRMKKDLRKAQRINNNKHPDNFFTRLSRKKIKLPQISTTKIHWPWTKKKESE